MNRGDYMNILQLCSYGNETNIGEVFSKMKYKFKERIMKKIFLALITIFARRSITSMRSTVPR